MQRAPTRGCQAPEQRQRVHELAQHGGQLRAPAEDGRLRGEPLRRPEAARGPVREGPGDAQLAHQREDVVVLRASTSTSSFPGGGLMRRLLWHGRLVLRTCNCDSDRTREGLLGATRLSKP